VKKYSRASWVKHDNTIRHTSFAHWITKATNTPPEYVILITFSRQQWLRGRALFLRLYIQFLLRVCSLL